MNRTNRKLLAFASAALAAVLIYAISRDFLATAVAFLAGLVVGLVLAWSVS